MVLHWSRSSKGVFGAFGCQILLSSCSLLCKCLCTHVVLLILFCNYSATKASIGASIIFILDKKTDLISAPHSLVYLGIVIFFIYFKLSSMLLGIHDPFLPFENLFCALFFGGIWDTLANFINGKKIDTFFGEKQNLFSTFLQREMPVKMAMRRTI